jgi:hypothetical protein
VADEPAAGDHDAQVDRREDAQTRDQGSGQAGGQVADEHRRDDDRPRGDQTDGHRVEELALGQPVLLADDPCLWANSA